MSNSNGFLKTQRNALRLAVAVTVFFLGSVKASTNAQAATPWYAVGSSHTLALKADGTVWAVGENGYGQLGNGTSSSWRTYEPQMVKGLEQVSAVAAGGAHSVALKQDGTVWAWGNNAAGQLGDGCQGNSPLPVQVKGLSDIKAIATGNSHVVVLKGDGTVWTWGNNRIGQLGNASKISSSTPVQVSGLTGVVSIAAGGFHTLALREDGTVWSWGYDANGALGNGEISRTGTAVPVHVAGLGNVKAIAAGLNHSVALKEDGSAWAWGSNAAHQLGERERFAESARPVQVAGIGGILDLTAKANHTVAVREDGSVWAWGDAGSGEWGNGLSMEGSDKPVQLRGLTGATQLAAVINPDTLIPSAKDHLAHLDQGRKLASAQEKAESVTVALVETY